MAGAFMSVSRRILLLCVLFFCSGFPALLYQIVWQRALFSMYGVNAESVAVVVSAFMLGLGLGGLLGGQLSERFRKHTVKLFVVSELGIGLYGALSLSLFHWMGRHTAGAGLGPTIAYSFLLLAIPTLLMGMTLPLLTTHLSQLSHDVGYSVSVLYFFNTLGSAAAAFAAAQFLMLHFGMSGTIRLAALINLAVALSAFLFTRVAESSQPGRSSPAATEESTVSLWLAITVAAISGFSALGYEIAWFRFCSWASSSRAQAFAMLLAAYLCGIAIGSVAVEHKLRHVSTETKILTLSMLLALSSGFSFFAGPLTAWLMTMGAPLGVTNLIYVVAAAMLGGIFPQMCSIATSSSGTVGRNVGLIYLANIVASTLGSFIVGFVLMDLLNIRQVCTLLSTVGILAALVLLFGSSHRPVRWKSAAITCAITLLAIVAGQRSYDHIFEKMLVKQPISDTLVFADLVESRSGVIGVTKDNVVYGGGAYDGTFNTDPALNNNIIDRAYAIPYFHPGPKRVLMIGLSSGSWAQVIVNHPAVEAFTVVEINSGYLKLIRKRELVSSILTNPKVNVVIDDGRRWLLAHPDEKFDLIVQNTTYHWRDHVSNLLSREYMELIKGHLHEGGVFYFNTTGSDEAIVTALSVMPHGLRVTNFLAVSATPLNLDASRWEDVLHRYQIDGKNVFERWDQMERSRSAYNCLSYLKYIDRSHQGHTMETTGHLRANVHPVRYITDDNMGMEWFGPEKVGH